MNLLIITDFVSIALIQIITSFTNVTVIDKKSLSNFIENFFSI